jgi:hypothetical protein
MGQNSRSSRNDARHSWFSGGLQQSKTSSIHHDATSEIRLSTRYAIRFNLLLSLLNSFGHSSPQLQASNVVLDGRHGSTMRTMLVLRATDRVER